MNNENDSVRADLKLTLHIVIATFATAVLGFLFKDKIEPAYESAKFSGAMLLITGCILLMSKVNQDKGYKGSKEMSYLESLLMGIIQAVAILPGISRSGITISFGLLAKFKKDFAATFSFYIAIPAMLGAGILKSFDVTHSDILLLKYYIPGFLASTITGIFAIKILLKHISKGKFYIYSIWCFLIGLFALIFL